MSRAAFDAKLAGIDALKKLENEPERNAALGKALGDRNNYVVAKAAQLTAELRAQTLIPELLAAFDRFITNAAKTDPQCWAKTVIVKALSDLEHDGADIYIRGLHHVQMESVWGGAEDMAGPLRARSALALVECRCLSDLDTLEHLIEALVDHDKSVRAEAAKAIGLIDRREAALVLRQHALVGDSQPEALAATYSALLAVDGVRAIAFLGRFLDDAGDAGQEAALALGSTHNPEALKLLRSALDRSKNPTMRLTLLSAIGITRLPEAFEFLLAEVERGSRPALEALKTMALTDAQRTQLQETLVRGA